MRFNFSLLKKICVLFLTTGLSGIVSGQAGGAVQNLSSEAPQLSIGDTWKFKKIEHPANKLTYQEQKVMALEDSKMAWIFIENLTSGFKIWWRFDTQKGATNGTFAYDATSANLIGRKLTENTQDSRLQFPLSVGKKYNIREYWNEARTGHTDYEITVAGIEEVVTGAGKFKAWKLLANGVWEDRAKDAKGQTKGEMWFSPEAKRFVLTKFVGTSPGKQPSTITFELVEWKKGN